MSTLDHSTPWRYECPRGHVHISTRQAGHFSCDACQRSGEVDGRYRYVIDKKTGRYVSVHGRELREDPDYLAYCRDCGWASDTSDLGNSYSQPTAKRAVSVHATHNGCDKAKSEVRQCV